MKTISTLQARFCTKLALIALGLIIMADSGSSAVIYRNNFGNANTPINDAGQDIAFNTTSIGWNMLRAQDGGNVSDESAASTIGAIRNGVGNPDNVANVNAPTSASDEYGIAFLRNATTPKYKGLAYTTQYLVDRSNYDIESFQWYANTALGTSTQRLALQVGGSWYVTTALTPAQGSFNSFTTPGNFSIFTIDIDSATWFSLTATVGSPFAIGGSSIALPTGNITGFGLFLDPGSTSNDYSRFDTFTINAVPEPGVLSLLGLTGLGFLARRRKREA